MESANILMVDDDKDIVDLVSDILEDEGFKVIKAYTGKEAIAQVESINVDLIILDIMMPDMDGFEVLRKIRDKVDVPIIFLTAKNKSIDKVVGFEIGADDYITKPFDDNELAARVKAHIRRDRRKNRDSLKSENGILKFKGIRINKNSYEVYKNDIKVELSTREFQILAYLMENPNVVLTRDQIYNSVWGYEDYGDINTVTVHIKKLREKIDKEDKLIKTIWGAGYKFIGERE